MEDSWFDFGITKLEVSLQQASSSTTPISGFIWLSQIDTTLKICRGVSKLSLDFWQCKVSPCPYIGGFLAQKNSIHYAKFDKTIHSCIGLSDPSAVPTIFHSPLS